MDPAHPGTRIAFFGGSFDPPHLGHIAVARAARQALSLDAVLFAPVAAQPLKPHGSIASFPDRLAMTRLAIADEPGFHISLLDAPQTDAPAARPNYTIDTLHNLRTNLPPGSHLFCLMGADSFLGMRRWHRAADIPFAAELIVASRPGEQLENLTAALPYGLILDPSEPAIKPAHNIEIRTYTIADAPGRSARFYLLPGLDVDVSASAIRAQIMAAPGSHQVELLPATVAGYIRAHHLYR